MNIDVFSFVLDLQAGVICGPIVDRILNAFKNQNGEKKVVDVVSARQLYAMGHCIAIKYLDDYYMVNKDTFFHFDINYYDLGKDCAMP